MNAPDKGRLELIVREPKEYAVPLELLDRAVAMLYSAIALAKQGGRWQLLVTGLLKSQAHRSRYWMDMSPSELSYQKIAATVCASLIRDRDLGFILTLPDSFDRRVVMPLLMQAVVEGNRHGWQGIVTYEPRQEMRAISRSQIAERLAAGSDAGPHPQALPSDAAPPWRLWTPGVRFLTGISDVRVTVSGLSDRSMSIRARVQSVARPAPSIIHRLDDEPIAAEDRGQSIASLGVCGRTQVASVVPRESTTPDPTASTAPLAPALNWRQSSSLVPTEVSGPSIQPVRARPRSSMPTDGRAKTIEPAPVRDNGQERLATTHREQRGWRVRTKFVKPTEQAKRRGFTPFKLDRFHAFFDRLESKRKPKK